jgi:hypothetical protein
MPSKKAPKKPGFAMFGSHNPSIKEEVHPIVEDDPVYYPRADELFYDNTIRSLLISFSASSIFLE